ncbi:MAG TPA: recombination mediator RecR [Chloroflexia bacterium]|nr:recombination mediator RecR [Chloroflexia bacterium]
MQTTPEPIARLIGELSRLPGIGPKSASRLTFYLLRNSREQAEALAAAITDVKDKIIFCTVCHNVTETDPCAICADPHRDRAKICAVEEPLDVMALERTGIYKGLYHVLHGAIQPLEGITPDKLRIPELLRRVKLGEVDEVILATNPNMEGEATAMYLARQLVPLGVQVTRLARGLPIGGDLEYADEVTLARAIEGRREM